MNTDLIFVVFAALVPPIWLVVGFIGYAVRTKRLALSGVPIANPRIRR